VTSSISYKLYTHYGIPYCMHMEGTRSVKKNWPDDGRKGDRNMLPVTCNT